MIPKSGIAGICFVVSAITLALAINPFTTYAQSPTPAEPAPNFLPQNFPNAANPPQPPEIEFNENFQNPQRTVKPAPPSEPLDKTPNHVHPVVLDIDIEPNMAEMAKMRLIELENNIELIKDIPMQSKEVKELKLLAKDFYDRSVMYYKAGNYRLSIIYSRLSVEIVHAIEELGGDRI